MGCPLHMLAQVNRFILFISDSGIRSQFRPETATPIRLVNQTSVLVGLIGLVFLFQDQEIKPFYVRFADMAMPLLLFSVPFINGRKHYRLAKNLFYISLNVHVFILSASLGMFSGAPLYFIPIIAGSALIFDFQKAKSGLPVLALPLLSILLLLVLDDHWAIDQEVHAGRLRTLFRYNFLVTVLLSLLLAWFTYQLSRKQQAQLKDSFSRQTELNRILRRNEKKLQKNLTYSAHLLEKLRVSKDYFKLLLKNASDITLVVDGKGYLKYVSPSFFRLTGFRPDEVAKNTVFDFVHPDDLNDALESFNARPGRKPPSGTLIFRCRKVDGTYLFMEAKGTNQLKDENMQGIIINARDITDRLHYEQEARWKEKNIRSILENNNNLIWLVDRKYHVLDFNSSIAKGYYQRYGVKLERNKNMMTPLPEEERKIWIARYEAVLKGGPKTFTERYLAGGEERTFKISVFPIKSDGEVEHFTVFSTDITEQEKAEKALIEAKEVAEEATKAKALFLSTMSHEIRTPMNAVIGMTHLLLQEDPKPEQIENLKILKFSAENLLVLMNDVLDFSKIEAGKIQFERTSFNLRQLVSNIKDSLLPAANEKRIELKVFQDAGLPGRVLADPVRLSQIITNLLSNAIKFTEQGGVEIKVTLLNNTRKHCLVEFRIRDSGIGIPQNMQKAVFESFTQASSDTTRRFGGTGLGLTITKRLLELQGSKIMLESREGEGSTFYFRLKFEKEEMPIVMNDTSKKEDGVSVLQDCRILMVEDNPLNVFVGTKFLQKWGVELHTAENGKIALELLSQHSFDLVLMDLQMPEMDGYETTRMIRNMEDPETARLPVLAISAAAEQKVQDKAFEAGMNDFVLKPFNPDELKLKLLKYLNPRPGGKV